MTTIQPKIQLNLSKTATLGREESGHCREVAGCRAVETRAECMDCPPKKKMVVVERWPLVEVRL